MLQALCRPPRDGTVGAIIVFKRSKHTSCILLTRYVWGFSQWLYIEWQLCWQGRSWPSNIVACLLQTNSEPQQLSYTNIFGFHPGDSYYLPATLFPLAVVRSFSTWSKCLHQLMCASGYLWMLYMNVCASIQWESVVTSRVRPQDLESSRQVSLEETVEYCKQIDCPFLETSAKVRTMAKLNN